MHIGRTPLAFLLLLVLIAVSHFSQSAQFESVIQHAIDLNRQTYNRLQVERSQDREANEEQTRKIVSIEIMRATTNNPNIKNHAGNINLTTKRINTCPLHSLRSFAKALIAKPP